MLRESNLLGELRQFSHSANGNQLCIYADPSGMKGALEDKFNIRRGRL